MVKLGLFSSDTVAMKNVFDNIKNIQYYKINRLNIN